MKNSKIFRFGLPIAGALAVALAAIAVTASAAGLNLNLVAAATPGKTAASPATGEHGAAKAELSAYCDTFMKNFASDLKVSQSAIDPAAKKALGQTIDQAVKDGKLTADQASKIKAAIPSGTLCAAAREGIPGLGHPPGGFGAGRQGLGELHTYMSAYMDAAARAAGLGSAADLKTAMASGQGLSAIAKAHGIDEPTFRKNLIANLTPTLDAAVSNGKLTADQEKAILAHLQTGPIPFWNARPPHNGTPPTGAPAPPAA